MALPEKFAALADGNTDNPPPAIDWRNSPNFIPTLTEVNQMKAHIANLERELAETKHALLIAEARAAVSVCANCRLRIVE